MSLHLLRVILVGFHLSKSEQWGIACQVKETVERGVVLHQAFPYEIPALSQFNIKESGKCGFLR